MKKKSFKKLFKKNIKKTLKKIGGVIPSYKSNKDDLEIYDSFIFDKFNVIFDGRIINFIDDNKQYIEITENLYNFKMVDLNKDELIDLKKKYYLEEFDNEDIITYNNNIKILLPEKQNVKYDLDLKYLILQNLIPDEEIYPSFVNCINKMLKELCKKKKFNDFIKTNKSPFSLVRNSTNFFGLRPQFNLFNKYTFINKYRELLDILLNDYNDEELKSKILSIFNNNEQYFINCCDYMAFIEYFSLYNKDFCIDKEKTKIGGTINNEDTINNDDTINNEDIKLDIDPETNQNQTNQNIIQSHAQETNQKNNQTLKTKTNQKNNQTLKTKTKQTIIQAPKKTNQQLCEEYKNNYENIFNNEYQYMTYGNFYEKNGFKKNLLTFEDYIKKEFKLIKEYKNDFINIIRDYKDTDITEKLGLDVVSFTILFYIKERLKHPYFGIGESGVRFFPISKINLLNNLLNIKNDKLIIRKNGSNSDLFDKYPRNTNYTDSTYFNKHFAGCTERAVFEIVKFTCFNGNKKIFKASKNIRKEIGDFINKNSKNIMNSKSNDTDIFNEFIELISNIKDNNINYKKKYTDVNGKEYLYEIPAVDITKILFYIFNKDFKNNIQTLSPHSSNSEFSVSTPSATPPLLQIKSDDNNIVDIRVILFDDDDNYDENEYTFTLTNKKTNIILIINVDIGHAEVIYKKDKSNINNNIIEKYYYINVDVNNEILKYIVYENVKIPLEYLNTNKVTNMSKLFLKDTSVLDAQAYETGDYNNYFKEKENREFEYWVDNDITNWDTINVTDMSRMFYKNKFFNQNISKWKTKNVTDMNRMFYKNNFFNQNISNWNTSNVTDMSRMFEECYSFNQDINWNTPNVTDMSEMFKDCRNFNQNISLNTSNVTDMSEMFDGCQKFNQSINWNTLNVTDMCRMFENCRNFNQNIILNTLNVTDMSEMFKDCRNFNQNIRNWNTSNVTDMSNMFDGCSRFNQDISNWDISKVKNMSYMFYDTKVDYNLYKKKWNLSSEYIKKNKIFPRNTIMRTIFGRQNI